MSRRRLDRASSPSSGPAGHLLPQGEKAVVRFVRALLSLSLGLILATATATARAQSPEDPEPTFETLTTAGPGPSGRITAMGVDRIELTTGDDPAKAIETTELVRASRESAAASLGDGACVLFPDGDRVVRAIVVSATDAAVEIQAPATGKTAFPLDALLGLVLAPPSDPDALDLLLHRVRTEPRTSEVVWLANGDRVVGSFQSMDELAVQIEVQGASRRIGREGITAIGFDPALVSYPRPEGPYLELGLLDGSRIGVTDAKLERGRVAGKARFGSELDLPLTDVVRIVPRTPAVDFLSERSPDGKSHIPYFDLVRPFQTDANVEGRPILLNGRAYDRGLGTWSRTLLAYKVREGDLRFQATVGVDDRAGPLGSVVFRVLTDGEARFTSPPMTFRDPPAAVDVDLTGAKLLILATEFGERGDVRDLADWAEARIIRQP